MTSDSSPEAGAQPGARALASRRNGAKSRGPKTTAGKARSSRNALKHGLRARRQILLADEDAAEYRAFQAAGQAELAPVGALQCELAARIVTTAWRARRADRLEAALLGRYLDADALDTGNAQEALGTGLMRDGYGPRALETLVRYRGSVLAELFRALAALKVLQADAREPPARPAPDAAPTILPPPRVTKRTREVRRSNDLTAGQGGFCALIGARRCAVAGLSSLPGAGQSIPKPARRARHPDQVRSGVSVGVGLAQRRRKALPGHLWPRAGDPQASGCRGHGRQRQMTPTKGA